MPKKLPNAKHQLRPVNLAKQKMAKHLEESAKAVCYAFGYETCGKRLPLRKLITFSYSNEMICKKCMKKIRIKRLTKTYKVIIKIAIKDAKNLYANLFFKQLGSVKVFNYPSLYGKRAEFLWRLRQENMDNPSFEQQIKQRMNFAYGYAIRNLDKDESEYQDTDSIIIKKSETEEPDSTD